MGTCTDLYSPPDTATVAGFLGRYRRPVWEPLAAAYVAAWTDPGDLVLDPFCQDGSVIRAAVAAGRRAVAITGNPLLALLVRVELAPPPAQDLGGAARQIYYASKVDTTLGEHLERLYATTCSRCHERVPADAFIWDRGAGLPVLRDYTCPHCQHAARELVPAEETAGHLAADPQGFHRRLVAERLRTDDRHDRLQQRLLELYTPRNVYALTSLLLKIELLFAGSALLEALRAALLHTLDVASKLNLVTEVGWQPVHSLQAPRQFREANVWRAFAAAVDAMATWPRRPAPVLAASLEEVAGGGSARAGAACIGVGPFSHLAARLQGRVSLALSQLPRFDPTFAALSYLWSGWLLGREGSRAAEHLLRQRAPQEARYLLALQSAVGAVGATLAPAAHAAFVFQAPATRYLESLLAAAGSAGLSLSHAWHGALDDRPAARCGARRAEHHVVFGRPAPGLRPPGDRVERAQTLAPRTAASVLAARAEPTPFTVLHGPIWEALAREGLLAGAKVAEAEALRRRLAQAVAQGLEASVGTLLVASAQGDDPDRTTWQLAQPAGEAPLADRVEALVREALGRGRPLGEVALGEELAERFPAPLTPSWPLIRASLEAYGTPVRPGEWALAPEEEPAQAGQRRRQLLDSVAEMGGRLGYDVPARCGERQLALPSLVPGQASPGADLAWLEDGQPAYDFLLRDTAESADLRAMAPPGAGRRVLVIPERRVDLWRQKLAAAPPWAAELERARWAFLRQAALDRLLAQPASRERFAAVLGLAEVGDQLSLFSA